MGIRSGAVADLVSVIRGSAAGTVDAGRGPRDGAEAEADDLDALRVDILTSVAEYQRRRAATNTREFRPGRTVVPYAGRVFDESDVVAATDAALEFWLTAGRWSRRLEHELAAAVGVGTARLVNSGSSANLLATFALTSPLLGDRRLRRGDEVITVAAGFPTTVAPIVQAGAVPVFVDVDPRTANVDVEALRAAVGPRTRGIALAHTLGNPFDVDAVLDVCEQHGLWLVEDNCDALGSTYTTRRSTAASDGSTRRTGSFGHLATASFYPAHHITTGEGGAVFVSDPLLERTVTSLRDWGRDCWCAPGCANTCGNRFGQTFGELPSGYDHKYVYSHFGFNLKMTDLQAAIGVQQLKRLDRVTAIRRRNHERLRARLAHCAPHVRVQEPTGGANPSWFAALLRVSPRAPFSRDELVAELERRRVQTRMLFAGNMVRQPAFDEMRATGTGSGSRVHSPAATT